MTFLFDLLPVELVQNIFRYLWAHEILHGFSNQSEYLDSILQSYDRYAICLCSMPKSQFDQICQRIQPKQVFSLAVMEDDDTPNQSTLFLSHFDIRQFINIRSFAYVSSDQSLSRYLDLLWQANRFKSLVIPHVSLEYEYILGTNATMILPQLKRLAANHHSLTKPMKNLRYLTVSHFYCYRFKDLLTLMPNLLSLNITMSLNIFPFWLKDIPTMNYLREFIVRIHYGRFTMGQIQQILDKMPRLIHFELELQDPIDVIGEEQWRTWIRHLNVDIEEAMDIIDGNQWKYSVSHLHTFDFRFYLSKIPSRPMLNSFQTPFWLEQKHWIVAFDDSSSSPYLFTIPRFAPKTAIYSMDYHSLPCTLSDLCLDQYVRTLHLPILRPLTHDFTNVTSLVLGTNENLDKDKILPYLQLPHLRSLTFDNLSLLDILSSEFVFKSICELDVRTTVSKSNAEQLCTIFPQIERLYITIDDVSTLILLIDELKFLSIAKFIYSDLLFMKALTRIWFQEHSSRLKINDHFTYQVNVNTVHLWITVG